MGLSGGEIFIVFLAILLFFGADRIPEFAKMLGKGMREFQKATNDIKQEINNHTQDIKQEFNDVSTTVKQDIDSAKDQMVDMTKDVIPPAEPTEPPGTKWKIKYEDKNSKNNDFSI